MVDAVRAFLAAWGALVACGVVIVSIWAAIWVMNRRDRRRREVQEQLWEMEQSIREESMSEEWRDWHRQWRAQQAEIRREARRRLGLPEEESRS